VAKGLLRPRNQVTRSQYLALALTHHHIYIYIYIYTRGHLRTYRAYERYFKWFHQETFDVEAALALVQEVHVPPSLSQPAWYWQEGSKAWVEVTVVGAGAKKGTWSLQYGHGQTISGVHRHQIWTSKTEPAPRAT
jgi:hypothetical protein